MTLTHAVLYSTFCIARLYLWCHRMGWLINAGLCAALVTNIVLNVLLLPHFGLTGAASASCVAAAVLLIAVFLSAWSCGLQIRLPTVLMCLLPLALTAGQVPAATVLALVIVFALATSFVFSWEEKKQLAVAARRFAMAT